MTNAAGGSTVMRMPGICALAAILMAAAFSARATAAPAPLPAMMAPLPNGIEVRHGGPLLTVTALSDEIVRVRIARDGTMPEDSSWAVPAEMRAHSVAVTPLQNGFATRAIRVAIDPESLELTITDLGGKVIVADAAEPISLDGRAFTFARLCA